MTDQLAHFLISSKAQGVHIAINRDCTPYSSPKPFNTITGNRFYKLLCQVRTNLPPGDEIAGPDLYIMLKQVATRTLFEGITDCHHRSLTTLLPLRPKHD